MNKFIKDKDLILSVFFILLFTALLAVISLFAHVNSEQSTLFHTMEKTKNESIQDNQ